MRQKFKVTLKSLDEIVKSHKLINICQDGTLVFDELHIPNRFLKLLEKDFELEKWDDNEEEFFNYNEDLLIPKSFCKSIKPTIEEINTITEFDDFLWNTDGLHYVGNGVFIHFYYDEDYDETYPESYSKSQIEKKFKLKLNILNS